jgi:hypothetical protein
VGVVVVGVTGPPVAVGAGAAGVGVAFGVGTEPWPLSVFGTTTEPWPLSVFGPCAGAAGAHAAVVHAAVAMSTVSQVPRCLVRLPAIFDQGLKQRE